MLQQVAPIVYVWLGSPLPRWCIGFIKRCRSLNIERNIYLLTDHPIAEESINKIVSIFTIPRLASIGSEYANLPASDDFWLYTSMRFFALERFCSERNIQEFYHLELDNIVGSLEGLEDALSNIGSGLFAPRDSVHRVIGSIVYCNKVTCLRKLLEIYRSSEVKNDMIALGKYAIHHPESFFALPTESYEFNKYLFPTVSPRLTGGIFDAASIGQYLFGTDPIHSRYGPLRNRFVNENCRHNWNRSQPFRVDKLSLYIDISLKQALSRKWTKVYNIHVHSKNINAVDQFFNNGSIYRRLLVGHSSIIQNWHLAIIGPIYRLLDISFNVLKRISVWVCSYGDD